MKVRIEAQPGELEERASDVVRVLEELTGGSLLAADYLEKSLRNHFSKEKELPVIADSVKRSKKHVDRIQKIMDEKIAAILD
jgi:hypothetical protein